RSRVCFTHLGLRRARSPLFPYTTLFRSVRGYVFDLMAIDRRSQKKGVYTPFFCTGLFHDPYERLWFFYFAGYPVDIFYGLVPMRSEEHTSELQSRENLVCRLLLDKKTTS